MLSLRKKRVSSFVDDFMEFQDSLEEATASGVTLPTCLAVPLVWRPVERKRGAIAARLAAALDRLLDKKEEGAAGGAGDGDGVWLRAALNTRNEKGEKAGEDGAPPAASEGAGRVGELSSHYHHLWAADLVMGLLFAAHKNPALAAAQTVLFALEHHKQQQGRQRQQQQQQDDDNDNDDDDDDNEDGLVVGTSTKASPATTTTWLEKIRSESGGLVAAFGGDSTPALDACVKEALRLSAHSLGAVRKVKASFFAIPTNCEEEGNEASRKVYRVSEGSYVGVSHILPHLCDLKAFPDASSFRPERFLAPQKGHDNAAATASAAPAAAEEVEVEVAGSAVGMGSYQLTTFSHGIHVCPGQRYAMVLVKIMVAAVLDAPLACLSETRATAATAKGGSAALLSSVVIPPLDFTRATLAQRSTKVSLPYSSAWR